MRHLPQLSPSSCHNRLHHLHLLLPHARRRSTHTQITVRTRRSAMGLRDFNPDRFPQAAAVANALAFSASWVDPHLRNLSSLTILQLNGGGLSFRRRRQLHGGEIQPLAHIVMVDPWHPWPDRLRFGVLTPPRHWIQEMREFTSLSIKDSASIGKFYFVLSLIVGIPFWQFQIQEIKV